MKRFWDLLAFFVCAAAAAFAWLSYDSRVDGPRYITLRRGAPPQK